MGSLLVRSATITILLEIVVAYLNRGRGVPLMFGLFLGIAGQKTASLGAAEKPQNMRPRHLVFPRKLPD